jgi:hypothetical protein
MAAQVAQQGNFGWQIWLENDPAPACKLQMPKGISIALTVNVTW